MGKRLNITFLEKHFTISHNLPGRDNKFAILPEELKYLRNFIDNDKLAILSKSVESDVIWDEIILILL